MDATSEHTLIARCRQGDEGAFRELVDLVQARLMDEEGRPDPRWAGPAIGAGTVNAFIRRLYGAVPHVQHLIRADVPDSERHRVVLEPYGYHWYRMGGLGYLHEREMV